MDMYVYWIWISLGDSILTSMFIRPCIFHISWEPGKYVVSCYVGLPVLCCEFGIPKKEEHGYSHCRMLYSLLPIPVFCMRPTLVEPASPPSTPRFCWHQWEPHPERWGRAGVSLGPGCAGQPVSWSEWKYFTYSTMNGMMKEYFNVLVLVFSVSIRAVRKQTVFYYLSKKPWWLPMLMLVTMGLISQIQ